MQSGGIGILTKSYQTIDLLSKKFQLKINIAPTLFVSFEPQPLFMRTDPKSGLVVSNPIPPE